MDKSSFYRGQFFKTLKAFCEVVDSGSFSNAALELGTSQPALSLQIQTLEKHLNTILFERKGPKIQITPDGARLYEMAKPVVDSIQNLPESFLNTRDDLSYGDLTIVGGEAVLLSLLPEILKEFCAQYPSIRVITQSTIVKNIPQILLSDDADFAIGSLFEEHNELVYQPIYSFSPMLIMPVQHPLTQIPEQNIQLSDIAAYGLILPPEYSYTWRVVQVIFQKHQLECPIKLIASSSEAVKRYVSAGMGISILTEACQLNDETIKAVPMDHYFPMRNYGLIQRRGKFLSAQALKFKKLILEWASRQNAMSVKINK
ncbi:LysR family transcriptional regulator [Neisseria sp. Ec49-e6-T10]|uniref:LysR family transcriptional regulator n=1 Tax=Neisseria sp. Ec49-e6-T10 TaxID=3140744 RepID=UPI003EB95176